MTKGIWIVLGLCVLIYVGLLLTSKHNAYDVGDSESSEASVVEVFDAYMQGAQNCDIARAMSLMTDASKSVVHFTCANYAAEVACYDLGSMQVYEQGDKALLSPVPFTRKGPTPIFFEKEHGAWKIAFHTMASGITMTGSACDAGWNWNGDALRREFCSFFDGHCPVE